MDKHPVSRLQEKMAKSHKALPTYMLQQVGNMFVCTLKVDGITVVGTGISMPSAKYDVANRALSRLVDDEPQPLATNLPSVSGVSSGVKLIDSLKQRASIESSTEQFEMLKNQGIAEPENKSNSVSESASSSVEEMSTKYMWSELQKYVSDPVLQTIQTYPVYILTLNIDDDCKTTIVEIGKTFEETYHNLLKKALLLVKNSQS